MATSTPVYIERTIGRVQAPTSAAGGRVTLNIPRDHLLSHLGLRVVFPSGGSANYVANAEDLAISLISVSGGGQVLMKELSLLDLTRNSVYQNQIAGVERVALAANTTGGYTSAILNFSVDRKDISCCVPSYLYTNLTLNVDWASLATYGGDAGLAYVDVVTRELIVTDELKALNYFINREYVTAKTFTQIGAVQNDIQLLSNNIIRRLLIMTSGGATGTGQRDNVVTNIDVLQDGTISHRSYVDFLQLATVNKQEFHLETRPTGTAMIGFDIDGNFASLPDTAPMTSFAIKFNVPSVANSATARVLVQELIRPVVK